MTAALDQLQAFLHAHQIIGGTVLTVLVVWAFISFPGPAVNPNKPWPDDNE